MAQSIGNIPVLRPFLFESDKSNIDKKWNEWQEDFYLYITATGVSKEQQKRGLLLHLGGRELKTVYNALSLHDHNFQSLMKKLNEYFGAKKNVTYERCIFKKARQNESEDTASYILRLRTLAKTCDYKNPDEEIRDHFVSTCNSKVLKEKLLLVNDLTLAKCLEIGKAKDLARQQVKEIEEMDSSQSRSSFSKFHEINNRGSCSKQMTDNHVHLSGLCFRCGDKFDKNHKAVCKAMGKTCNTCQKKNHLSKCCMLKEKCEDFSPLSRQFNSDTKRKNGMEQKTRACDSLTVIPKKQTKSTKIKIDGVEIEMVTDSRYSTQIPRKPSENEVIIREKKKKAFEKTQHYNDVTKKPSKSNIEIADRISSKQRKNINMVTSNYSKHSSKDFHRSESKMNSVNEKSNKQTRNFTYFQGLPKHDIHLSSNANRNEEMEKNKRRNIKILTPD